MTTLIRSVWLVLLSSMVSIYVYWYSLSSAETQNVEAISERIVDIAYESWIQQNDLLSLINNFQQWRTLSDKQQAILQALVMQIEQSRDQQGEEEKNDTEKEETPLPWSVQEMQQKEFIWSDLVFEEVLATNSAYTRYRISYKSNGLTISGIMNIPQGEWPYPLVILNHGYIDPAVYTVWRGLKREQDYLARNGYVVLHTDYRNHGLSDRSPDLEQLYYFRNYFFGTDSINAINATKALWDARIDTERVAMLGHSMGGGVTMHAMLAQPELIDAAVMYAPVHIRERENFNRWRREDLSSYELELLQSRIGSVDDDRSFAPYSADTYLHTISVPVQYYHGTRDADVPYAWSVEAVEKLSSINDHVEFITFEGEQHEFWFKRNEFMEGVVAFLDRSI